MITRILPRHLLIGGALSLFVLPLQAQVKVDGVTRATRDEMQRSMKQLQIEGEPKPYFISYEITDSIRTEASASFGALLSSAQLRTRTLAVTVRVGDHGFDNTGPGNGASNNPQFILSALLTANTPLPEDDNYDEVRRKIWLATDTAYKRAVQQLSARKANQSIRNEEDKVASFSKQPPREESEILPPVTANVSDAEHMVRAASAVFRSVPSVEASTARITILNTTELYLNSEGTRYTRQIPEIHFAAQAAVRSKTGETFTDSFNEYSRSWSEFPKEPALVEETAEIGRALATRLKGKVAKRYNGPVLMEGEAAAELFANAFGNQLALRNGSGTANASQLASILLNGIVGDGSSRSTGSFLNKIGSRVLPDFITVVDNPQLTQEDGRRLLGNYKFDQEGVPSQETVLVEDGILKTLLSSRTPARGISASTGNMREQGVMSGNLLVSASKTSTTDELKAQLIDLIKSRGLEYGYIVRKLENQRAVEAVRVFPDAHEELVRDARLAEITPATFKDILAVSKDQAIYTRSGAGDDLVSYVVPSMLFEDITVEHVPNESPKLPVTTSPMEGR